LTQQLLAPGFELLRCRLEKLELRSKQHREDHDAMNDDRQQDPITTVDGAADDELVQIPVIEVESNHWIEVTIITP